MGTWTVAATAASVVALLLLAVPLLLARASATGRLGRWESRLGRWAAGWPERHPWMARNAWLFALPIPVVWVVLAVVDLARGQSPVWLAVLRGVLWTSLGIQLAWGGNRARARQQRPGTSGGDPPR